MITTLPCCVTFRWRSLVLFEKTYTLFLDVFSTLFFRYFLELCLVDINTVPTVLRKYDTIQTQIHHATKQPCMHLILCSAVEDPHLNLGL